MTSVLQTGVLELIRRLIRPSGNDNLGDGQLLRRFVACRDEAAFAALLERHGPLVLGVCRQVLGDPHDAEDAFQATFLVLARKAAAIRRQELLGAWLYRVAVNIARSARAGAARRRSCERQAAQMAGRNVADTASAGDWQPVLHEEVGRLPAKYRAPVVHCYWQGRTHEEAAQQLGWPVGTVKGRLARARELLRARLVRRGFALPASGVAVLLAGNATGAAVPAALVEATQKAALFFTAGPAAATAVSATTLHLAKGALRTMMLTRFLTMALFVLAFGVVGLGGGLLALSFQQEGAAQGRPNQEIPREGAVQGRPQQALQQQPTDDFGPAVKGLRARVTLSREQFAVGEPVAVIYVVKNVSQHEQTLWHCGFWPNHQVLVRDAAGREPLLTAQGRLARQAFSPGGPRLGNVPFRLPPNAQDATEGRFDLATLYDLSKPGRYTVQYVYEEKNGGWEGRLPSNRAAFTIRPPQKPAGGPVLAESKPVRVNDVDFQAVVDKKLILPAVGGQTPVQVGLRVTNKGKNPLLFNLYDTIRPKMQSVDGKALAAVYLRDATRIPKPELVKPGEAKTILWRGHLTDGAAGKSGRLYWIDDTAGQWHLDGLTPGTYLLSLQFQDTEASLADRRLMGLVPAQGPSLWLGKAVTLEVKFEIAPRPPEGVEAGKMPIETLIKDLSSNDGKVRCAATKELLRRGKAIVPDLAKAGAREVVAITAPTNLKPPTRRLDMVYSLLRGLPRMDAKSQIGVRQDRITLALEKGTTREEFLQMAERHRFGLHFETGKEFQPGAAAVVDVVLLEPNRTLEQAVTKILTTEPRVVTISLIVPVLSEG